MPIPTSRLWSPDDPDVLKVLANPHRVIPFLGAGMTLPAGLPDTAGLAAFLQGTDLGRGIEFGAHAGLADTFNLIADAHSLGAVQQATAEHITALSSQARDVPAPYRHLVHIPSRWAVTLSYDMFLERAAHEAQRPFLSLTWKDADALNRLRAEYIATEDKGDRLIIFHLHGSVDRPETMVADRSGYREVAEDGVIRNLLVALLSHHRACWMGSSLDEPYLVTLLGSLATGTATHCFIGDQPAVESVRDAARARVSKGQHGLAYAHFPAGDWHRLTEFCQWLVNKQPVSSAPLSAGEPSTPAGPQLSTSSAPTYVWADWGPEWTRKALAALGDDHPHELAALRSALTASSIEALLAENAAWLTYGSWQLLVAAARFAEEHGNWSLSSTAWQMASSRPGADQARCLVSAAIAADMASEDALAEELMRGAREIDPLNARVLLRDVGELDRREQRLDVLSLLFDEDGDVGTLARCHAVIESLLGGDFDAAKRHLGAAEARASDLVQVRLARINLLVHLGRSNVADGARVDARQLQAAKEDALALRAELLPQRRFAETCRLVMLAADATSAQGELEDAATLLRTTLPEEVDVEDGRQVLADAALRAQDYVGALELLAPLDDSPEVDAMRAQADINTGDHAARLAGWDRMCELLTEAGIEDHVAERCARVLIFVAHDFPEADFPESAADWLSAHGDTSHTLIGRALWLHRRGQSDEARALLRANEPAAWAFEAALQLALWDDDTGEISRLATRVLRDNDEPHTRLLCARKLAAAGDADRGREVATAIALDESAASRDRGDAFALLCQLIMERDGDYEEGLDWLRRWSQVVPSDRRQVWGRIQSMLRLGHHDEAIELLLNTSVAIETRGEARIAAQAYLLMPDRMKGLARLADLLESLPNPDPELERRAWFGLLLAGDSIPDDLAQRLRPAPGFEIPGKQVTLDEMLAHLRQRHQTVEEVARDVAAGGAAATKLAQVAGRQMTTMWLALDGKPSGFGTSDWAQLERANAEHALTRGVVADTTAMAGLTMLPERVRETALRRLLAPFRIAQSCSDDIVQAAVDGSGTGRVLGYDAERDAPVAVEEADALVAHRQATLDAVRDLARKQRVEPDHRNDQPSALEALLGDPVDVPVSVRSLTASLVIAERTGRPLYCDDRVGRRLAHQLGLRAFGVGSLLEGLVAVNAVSAADACEAITTLRAAGYRGIPLIEGELEHLIGGPSRNSGIRTIVEDPMLWDAGAVEQLVRVLEILHRSHERDASDFSALTASVLDWAIEAADGDRVLPRTTRAERVIMIVEILTIICLVATTGRGVAGRFLPRLYVELERYATRCAGAQRGEIVEAAVQWLKRNLDVDLTLQNFCQLPLWHQMRMVGVDADKPPPVGLSESALSEALARSGGKTSGSA